MNVYTYSNLLSVLFFVFSFGISSCSTSKKVSLTSSHEIGKCIYYLHEINDSIQHNFSIEIVPATFTGTEIKYRKEQLKDYQSADSTFYLPVRAAHLVIDFKNDQLSNFVNIENPEGFLYCMRQKNEEYKAFTRKELMELNFTILYMSLKDDARIIKTYYDKRPKQMVKSQMYFEGGSLSPPKEAICPSDDCGINTYEIVLSIQQKLNALGYNIEENNEISDETRIAIKDYQKKNNLKVGQIDYELLESLGL